MPKNAHPVTIPVFRAERSYKQFAVGSKLSVTATTWADLQSSQECGVSFGFRVPCGLSYRGTGHYARIHRRETIQKYSFANAWVL